MKSSNMFENLTVPFTIIKEIPENATNNEIQYNWKKEIQSPVGILSIIGMMQVAKIFRNSI